MSDYGDDDYDDFYDDAMGDWLYVEDAYDEAVSTRAKVGNLSTAFATSRVSGEAWKTLQLT